MSTEFWYFSCKFFFFCSQLHTVVNEVSPAIFLSPPYKTLKKHILLLIKILIANCHRVYYITHTRAHGLQNVYFFALCVTRVEARV